jgi:TPR repeat protein
MLGLANCQVSLGEMFELGRGVKKDYTPAVKYYKAAAEQGHVEAQSKLKSVYEKVNKEYLDAQKAVAQQQMQQMQQIQQHQELQLRFQQQLLQAQHQQMQQIQQQFSNSSLAAAPVPPASSLASVIAGNCMSLAINCICTSYTSPF